MPPGSQTVRLITFETDSLDPHVSNESTITHALFDGLTEYNNQNAEVTPSLGRKLAKKRGRDGVDFPAAEKCHME